MTDTQTPLPSPEPSIARRPRRRVLLAAAAIIVLAGGAVAGASATHLAQRWRPQSVMLLQPTPIAQFTDDTPVAAKGAVAEIFGNKFIVQDDSGRALVDLGPRGDRNSAVTKGEAVTVQGHFDRGVLRAQVLTHADGRSEAFGPPKPPHRDRRPPPGDIDRLPPPPPMAPAQ